MDLCAGQIAPRVLLLLLVFWGGIRLLPLSHVSCRKGSDLVGVSFCCYHFLAVCGLILLPLHVSNGLWGVSEREAQAPLWHTHADVRNLLGGREGTTRHAPLRCL